MATQAIRFKAAPGKTLTLDVFTLASDTAEQSALTCTEATNRKGLYSTQTFSDTLDGRYYIVKKEGGTAIDSEMVTMDNADGTYDADSVSPVATIISEVKADTALGKAGLLRHAAKASVPIGQGTSFNIQGRTNLAVYGDSIGAGTGASTTANRWANIVATAQGMNLLNYSVGGRGVWAAASAVQAAPALEAPAIIWSPGLNDIRRGSNPAKTRRKIEACIYSAILAACSDVVTNGDDLTKTGTWTTYGAASVGGRSASGTYADTAGPVLTYTFTGTSFGIGFIVNSGDVETFGSAKVRIDGEEIDHVYLNNWMDYKSDSVNDNRRGPLGRLYCGFGNTTHTVEIEAVGNQIVPVDYVCTLKPPHSCIPVLLCDIPYLNAAGYAEDPLYATDELIDIVNQLHREIAAKVSSLGFPVGIAEATKYYDLLDGLSDDNIHPNDTGHAQIARGINESIKYAEGYELPQLSLGVRQNNIKVKSIQKIAESDQLFVANGSIYELRVYERGTDKEILDRKRIKKLGGTDMTSPGTEVLGGFQEPS